MTENQTAQTADEMFADADLDAESSVDAPTPAEQEAALVAASTPEEEAPAPAKEPIAEGIRDLKAFEKGTWQHSLVESAVLAERATKATDKSTSLMWTGAKAAITEWEANSDVDVYAEVLAADLLDILGKPLKGTVSKIKTIALAVKNKGLVLDAHPSLRKAYIEAKRLTETVANEKVEDDAADTAVEAIVAPAQAATPEDAALLLLSKGVDGAIVAILDALNGASGEQNHNAHRAFFRQVGVEVQSRVQAAKPEKAPAPAKDKPAPAKVAPAPAKAQPAAAKAKPAPAKAAPAKATPSAAAARQSDPTKKALPAKVAPVKR